MHTTDLATWTPDELEEYYNHLVTMIVGANEMGNKRLLEGAQDEANRVMLERNQRMFIRKWEESR